jgi:transcription antitermination factor NusG
MLSNNNGKFWFALHVKSRMEQTTGELLRTKGYETFVPTYKPAESRSSVHMPLFSGYAFCRFDPDIRCPILTTPGVLRVVGYGKSPAVVCETEIEAIRTIVLSSLDAKPHEHLTTGQVVIVKQGPLRGIVGKIVSLRSATRLIVSISLLQRSVSVEIDGECVQLVQDPATKLMGTENDFIRSGALLAQTKLHRPTLSV